MNLEAINKDFLKIYKSIEKLIENYSDPKEFALDIFHIDSIDEELSNILKSINEFNLLAKLNQNKMFDLENCKIELCKLISEFPDMNNVYTFQSNKALAIIKNYELKRSKFNKFSREERYNMIDNEHPIYLEAIKFQNNTNSKIKYDYIKLKIDGWKELYCIYSESPILKIKATYIHRIKFFCDLLIPDYLDRENAAKFEQLLSGENPEGIINWNIDTQAKVSRLLNQLNDDNLFDESPAWKILKSKFTIKGKPCKSIKTGASSKKTDSISEDLVKRGLFD